MRDELDIIDQALETGRLELGHLAGGEVEEAERLAGERLALMEEAWRMRDPRKIGALKQKLLQLQSIQGQITAEAKRLHEAIRRDLLRAKQENQRLTGYRSSMRTSAAGSRFVDKAG
ncbi:hypothetical protein NNJEOMEG_02396 [Fundidesulfovibrio magnetotacticus]|uniref:Flagellar protein FliT n=1 Tax=Fundidesulfovibrio magnetotacticus TaxID=2730080 RepID=A0A6V8LUB8_9BACT|nr:hypothetical protein [Fundidesulfovibrio magnetotacticus]GFK94550.1 hypothetical protein NNJEOMEG_02396 [Fundidesulfovibrio magnetotacticus]